jgi:hypothetical protein
MHSAQILQLIDKILEYIKSCQYFLTFILYSFPDLFNLNCCSVSINMTRERSTMDQPLSDPLSAAVLFPSIVLSYVLSELSSHCTHVPTATTM